MTQKIAGASSAFIALTAANVAFHLGVVHEHLRPAGSEGAFAVPLALVFGLAAAGCLASSLSGSTARAWRHVLMALLVVSHPASLLVGMDAVPARLFTAAGMGAGIAVCCRLFFTLTPTCRKGFLYCLTVAGGIGGRYAVSLLTRDMERRAALEFVFGCTLWFSAIMAAAGIAALFCLSNPPIENNASVPGPPSKNLVRRLIPAIFLYAVLSGFQTGRFFPYADAEAARRFSLLPFCVMAAALSAGLLLDRDFDLWFRRIVRTCACVFVLIPALPLIAASSPNLHNVLYSLAAVGDLLLFCGATLAMERLAGGRKYWLLLALTPWIACVLSVFLPKADQFDPGLRTLVSIMAAAAFYELVGVQSRKAAPSDPDAPDDTEKKLAQMFLSYKLTDRESEVARLLLRGMSTPEMAKRLFISEATVKFHVKNILSKSQVATRGLFLAKFFSDGL